MKTTLSIFAAALVLTGCVTTAQDNTYRVTQVAAEDALIQFDGPAFSGGTQDNLRYVDRWQVEEIATFRKDGAVLQAWFTAAHRDQTIAMQFPYTVTNFAKLWRDVPDEAVFADDFDRANLSGRLFLTRDFVMVAGGPSCFAFGTEYDGPSTDRRARPGAGLFGYYCAPDQQQFNDKARLQVLAGLWAPNREAERPEWLEAGNPEALASAQTQLAEFPFTFGHFFSEGDGDNFE